MIFDVLALRQLKELTSFQQTESSRTPYLHTEEDEKLLIHWSWPWSQNAIQILMTHHACCYEHSFNLKFENYDIFYTSVFSKSQFAARSYCLNSHYHFLGWFIQPFEWKPLEPYVSWYVGWGQSMSKHLRATPHRNTSVSIIPVFYIVRITLLTLALYCRINIWCTSMCICIS